MNTNLKTLNMEALDRIVSDLQNDIKYHAEKIDKSEKRLELANEALMAVRSKGIEELIEIAEFDVRYYNEQVKKHTSSFNVSKSAVEALKEKTAV